MGTNTPELGLSQPTPNDPAVNNIWGTILNNNFGLIDSAVAGLLTLSVAGSSNVVLTSTTGIADQERNAMFVFTGALTGNINVLYPAGKTKVFGVKNSTTGSFTLSVGVNNGASAPAGAVATVTQGGSGFFYSDGTNVYSLSISSANPTFTGTVTFPDGGTWDSTGIASLTKLGIGMTASNILDITQTQNAASIIKLFNGNTSTTASARIRVAGNGSIADFCMTGTGFTPVGVQRADALFILSNGGGGTTIGTSGAARPIYFAVNDAEVGRFGSDGSFLVGSTTNAGAGSIGATGNITAYYSDERLKTRIGPVENAIGKIMSLSAFYYRANETAHELSNGIYDPSIREVGLSAQEVERVLPEVVAPAPFNHDYKTLRYERIVALLIAGMQEQQHEIDELKKRLPA